MNELGYNGKRVDAVTGWYDYGFRDYAPMVARFTTVDPVRDGANWYAYVGNDPVNRVDPWGLETVIMSQDIPASSFVHLFIAQKDEETGKVSTFSLHPAGGVTAGLVTILIPGDDYKVNPALTPNFEGELEAARVYFEKGQLPGGYQYEYHPPVPSGMSQDEFDNAVKEQSNTYPLGDRPYEGWYGPNSNTFVDDVVEGAGSSIPDIPGAQAQNWGDPDAVSGAAPNCSGIGY